MKENKVENIFEGAKFGDKFLTRNGNTIMYWCTQESNKDLMYPGGIVFCLENGETIQLVQYPNKSMWYNVKGEVIKDFEIVSKYQDTIEFLHDDKFTFNLPIDEDKLDELAQEHCLNNGYYGCCEDEYIEDHSTTYGDIMNDIEKAYKAGYRKAKEE